VEGEGFEPSKAEPTDLQSAPFDRSGTPPNETGHYSKISFWCQTPRERSGISAAENAHASTIAHNVIQRGARLPRSVDGKGGCRAYPDSFDTPSDRTHIDACRGTMITPGSDGRRERRTRVVASRSRPNFSASGKAHTHSCHTTVHGALFWSRAFDRRWTKLKGVRTVEPKRAGRKCHQSLYKVARKRYNRPAMR
jgi:hypothetical protein